MKRNTGVTSYCSVFVIKQLEINYKYLVHNSIILIVVDVCNRSNKCETHTRSLSVVISHPWFRIVGRVLDDNSSALRGKTSTTGASRQV